MPARRFRDEVEGGGDSDRDGGRDRGGDERAGPAHEGLRHIEADRAAGHPQSRREQFDHQHPGLFQSGHPRRTTAKRYHRGHSRALRSDSAP